MCSVIWFSSTASTSCACAIGAVTSMIGSFGVDDPPLGHGPDVALEAHAAEILDRAIVEADLAQVPELVLLEDERLEEPEAVLEARRHQEARAASACPARRG